MTQPLVYVRWVDSCNHKQGRWTTVDDLDTAENYCETVGFRVLENEHSLFLAASIAPEEVGDVIQIPKVAIVESKPLRVGE